MRATWVDVLILNLQGEISPDQWPEPFMQPDEAATELRRITGQDFGCDADQWLTWLRHNRRDLLFHFDTPPTLLQRLLDWVASRLR